MKRRSRLRPSHLAALAAVAGLAGCQLVAGLGGITPNDTSSSGHGGGGAGAGSTTGSAAGGGGTTASAGGSCGSGGAGGFVCESVATFDDGPTVARGVLGVDAKGAGYVSSLAKGTPQFGMCAAGLACPFIHRFDEHGAPMQTAMLARAGAGAVTFDGLAVIQAPSPSVGVAFAGTLGSTASLALPGMNMVSSTSGSLYVAALSADLGGLLWSRQLDLPDSNAAVRVAVDSDNNVRVAGNVRSSLPFAWTPCATTGGSGDEDVFLATLDPTMHGMCTAMTTFGGAGDQTVDAFRVVGNGRAIVAGTFTDQITFPSAAASAPVSSAAYYAYFTGDGMDHWREFFIGSTVHIVGASISPAYQYAAVSGNYTMATVGLLPVQGLPGSKSCGSNANPAPRGFVKVHSGADGGSPATSVLICFGDQGTTSIDDVSVNDDGSFIVAGNTTGSVTYQGFSIPMHQSTQAFFLLKIDANGDLVWSKTSDTTVNQQLVGLGAIDDGVVAGGLFSGNLDLGCSCRKIGVGGLDAFAAHIEP